VIKLALGVSDDVTMLGSMASSQWYDPIPRYGHSTIVDAFKNILIYAGSGSMFLADIMLIDPEPL